MRYISKNKEIPEAISKITLEEKGIQELLQAIEIGDFTSSIFNAENCDLYLLFLFNESNAIYRSSNTCS